MKTNKSDQKRLDYADEFTVRTGIVMENFSYDVVSSREKILTCLFRGLIIFVGIFGITGLFVTSFELTCNLSLVFIMEFFLSIIIALLYFNKWLFNIGYLVILVLFCIFAFTFREYANSGFNSIINLILNTIDNKMNLDGVREYTEVFSNRYLTITICLLLINFVGVCYLNSSISGYMSPTFLFIQLFPIVQVCMYLDDDINYFYLVCVVACWLSVLIIKKSGRYRINLDRKVLFFSTKKDKITYTEKHIHKSIVCLLATGIVSAVLMFSVGFGVSRLLPYPLRSNISTWKEGTDQFVENFALNGFFGFFNNYSATGGMNGGRLGGVREVTMDFQTDLIVNFVPNSIDDVYLKGFVGEQYEDHQWSSLSNYEDLHYSPYYFSDFSDLVNKESNALSSLYEYGDSYSAKAMMQITNVDADQDYYYQPYYTQVDQSELIYLSGTSEIFHGDVVKSRTPVGRIYRVDYYPLTDHSLLYKTSNEYESYYRRYVYENYLQIPDEIESDLETICKKNNFGGTTEEVIEQIREYFYNNFKYTMSPGVTPESKDFVLYFLKKQKRGYCAHFASAGAMLLREMGIPARYVEGYCISAVSMLDTETLSGEQIEDWYTGYSSLATGQDSIQRVLNLEVTDASAHAWVEVYIDGFGWIPAEFTIAEEDETVTEESFWSNFRDFFGGNSENGESPIANITNQVKKSMVYLWLVLIAVVCGTLVIWYTRRLIRMYRLYYKPSKKRLVSQYQAISRLLKKYKLADNVNLYHEITKGILMEKLQMDEKILKTYIELIVMASYSDEKLTVKELSWCTDVFKEFIRQLKRKVERKSRIMLTIKY